MFWLSLPWYGWLLLAVWVCSVTWVVLFFGLAARPLPDDIVYDGPLAEVIELRPGFVLCDEPPEYRPFRDWQQEDWVS